ncbi:hypothetical protein A3E89_00340 [Candidatus Campbellbacteria bacterium RIFCSPHIGHO2_12_FULL_35_10]|uniref:Uncharacterized protein n=1 Tax=Candidatus Campbellbacteria bacterium RIFCSPHIGHO2_12_FULL_35_10 TaxID=1797578 RepID=A0A1F5EM12_9BACT|nr:MAG: hypothetical protein A3E89_00340 [Candidatus Campbellbacteria bacterium RIFCSPHIGHO2_12_FULL_35_10]
MGEKNCWEHGKGCKVKEDCPAYPNNGRICFSVTGTLCHGAIQGNYKDKQSVCRACDFYKNEIHGLVDRRRPAAEKSSAKTSAGRLNRR